MEGEGGLEGFSVSCAVVQTPIFQEILQAVISSKYQGLSALSSHLPSLLCPQRIIH